MENNFYKLNYETKKALIETLIFVSDEPLTDDTIFNLLISMDKENQTPIEHSNSEEFQNFVLELKQIIDQINNELLETGRPYHIIRIANGWQFATQKEYGKIVRHFYKSRQVRKLSNAALEVLAIIAYRQPITKPEIEMIRGVNSNETVNSLLEKNLIKISGRKSVLGRPLEYSTTDDFLKLFGLNSLDELPEISEFEEIVKRELNQNENEITLDVSNEQMEQIQANIEKFDLN